MRGIKLLGVLHLVYAVFVIVSWLRLCENAVPVWFVIRKKVVMWYSHQNAPSLLSVTLAPITVETNE